MSKLRDAFLNAKPKAEIVTVPLPSGEQKVEMREKTVAEQFALLKKARKSDGELDEELLSVETIISTTFDPETGDRVFEAADRDTIKNMPAGPYNILLQAANRAAGLEAEDEVVSGLEETPADEASSG